MLAYFLGCVLLSLAYLLIGVGQSNNLPALLLPMGLLFVFPCLRAEFVSVRDRFFGRKYEKDDVGPISPDLLMVIGLIAAGITALPIARSFTHEQTIFLYGVAGLCLLYGVYECAMGKGLVSSTAEISISVLVCCAGAWLLHATVNDHNESRLENAMYISCGTVVMYFGWLGMRRWVTDATDKPTYPPASTPWLAFTAISVWALLWLLLNYPLLVYFFVGMPLGMLFLFSAVVLLGVCLEENMRKIIRPPRAGVGTSLVICAGIICLIIAFASWHELALHYRWSLLLSGIATLLFETFGGYLKPWARRERGYR